MEQQEARESKIITFYSYKGGVGRSAALVSTAVVLARDHGLDVVVVDWDLGGPSLHHFFGIPEEHVRAGIIDYLCEYKEMLTDPTMIIPEEPLSIRPLLIDARPAHPDRELDYEPEHFRYPSGGRVRLLPAGNLREPLIHAQRVSDFDWGEFCSVWLGDRLLKHIRGQLETMADVTLIDSPAGLTDVSGVCTMRLPDTVVLVFAFNEQNINGIERKAMELTSNDPVFASLGRGPELLFLASRSDRFAELLLHHEWQCYAVQRLGRFAPLADQIHVSSRCFLDELTVPYNPFLNYGEKIAVEETFVEHESHAPFQVLARSLVAQDPEAEICTESCGEEPQRPTTPAERGRASKVPGRHLFHRVWTRIKRQ